MSRSGDDRERGDLACSSRSCVAACDAFDEPGPELGAGVGHPTTDEVGVGIDEVGGDGEHPPDRHRLLVEDALGQLVAPLSVVADLLGGDAEGDVGQRVVRVSGQPERQQIVGDAAQRRDALEVADEPAVAPRHRLARHQEAVHRDLDVAELAGHPGRATDHSTGLDDAAAQSGSDDRRDR